MFVVMMLLLGLTDTETGFPREEFLHGYTAVPVPPVCDTGQGEWTGSGPWGGNLRALVPAVGDNSIVIAACGYSMTADAGGVWRSTDGGVTWNGTDLNGIQVNDACAAPPSTFYAATRTGLYVSTDNGENWSVVSGMPSAYVIKIGVSQADPDVLIAGLSSNSGIRRSVDGGATWHEVGLSEGFMKGFGCDPDHPDTMYVAMSGLAQSVFRSTNGGASWSPIGPGGSGWGFLMAPFGTGETMIVTHDDGFYMTANYGDSWELAVAGTSYAPAVCDGSNLFAPVITAGGVYESTDLGASWSLNTYGITASYWQAGCYSSAGYLVGHNGGIYRSLDPGAQYQVSQQGIENAYIHTVSYISATGTLFAAGEYHGLWKSTDAGANWEIVYPGPANWTIYDIAPGSDLHYQGPVMYAATASGVYRSDDWGDSWAGAGFTGTQVSSVVFDPGDPDRAWAGTATTGVHFTTDGGQNWTAGSGLPFALYPSLELIELEGGDLRVLASFQQNASAVYWSDDGGATFTAAPVPGSYHPGLSTRWGADAMAYLATDGGIYRSWDRGATWEQCPGSSGMSWAVLGEVDDNVLNGTGTTGVRWSPDLGETWQLLNTGIENRCVWDISYGDTPGQLFAGLRGFGVVELTEDQLGISGPTPAMLSISARPNPASGPVTLSVLGQGSETVTMRVFNTAGRLCSTLEGHSGNTVWTPDESTPAGVYLVKAFTANGTAVSRVVLLR